MSGGQGHALGVVAGRGGDHRRTCRQTEDAVIAAADLERAGALQLLGLEEQLAADELADRVGGDDRCRPDHATQALGRLGDVVEVDEGRRCTRPYPYAYGGDLDPSSR